MTWVFAILTALIAAIAYFLGMNVGREKAEEMIDRIREERARVEGLEPLYKSYRVAWSENDGNFLARCEQHPGCTGTGLTPGDAVADAEDTVRAFLEHKKELGV